ncbi:class E sortase [Mumia xiangluensis]|uniref:Class E sortase n=1 Tax=Mumia xiangluensis TaxID=1678900 RepID=A0ABW1QQL1_9ACTN
MNQSAVVARAFARTAAELLVTGGVVVLLFAAYVVVWSDVQTAAAQVELRDDFKSQAQSADAPAPGTTATPEPLAVPPGDAMAVMRIPRLGDDWSWVVVEGVSDEQLNRGPGHFPETALPGQIGNFAIAGHRATHGEPFAHLDRMAPGDEIVVESIGVTYTYVVDTTEIVTPSDVGVLLPVPGKPDKASRKARITLVTCNPRWGSSERLIVHGHLTETVIGSEV